MDTKRVTPRAITALTSKAGKASAAALTPEERSERARRAATAAAPEERSERARTAAKARWAKKQATAPPPE